MYFKNIDDELLVEASHVLFDEDQVFIPMQFEVTEHAIRRFIQRATKGRVKDANRLVCNCEIGKILSPQHKRDNYMGSTYDAKYGTTYWYRGNTNNGKVKFLVPQNQFGQIKTVVNWGFDNDEVKFLKSRIITLAEQIKQERKHNSI